jgi:hypothetical protein
MGLYKIKEESKIHKLVVDNFPRLIPLVPINVNDGDGESDDEDDNVDDIEPEPLGLVPPHQILEDYVHPFDGLLWDRQSEIEKNENEIRYLKNKVHRLKAEKEALITRSDYDYLLQIREQCYRNYWSEITKFESNNARRVKYILNQFREGNKFLERFDDYYNIQEFHRHYFKEDLIE